MPNSYVIVPCCSDLNRGDQALVWETRRIAEDAGLKGRYYFTSEANEPVVQSEKHGFTRILPVLSPDLAFNLKPAQLDKDEVFAAYNIPADRKVVAITVRPYRFPDASDPKAAYEFFKRGVTDFVEWLYEQGYIAVFVNHTLAVNSHENDYACITEVAKMLPEGHYRVISNSDYDCQDLKRLYSFCDYIVGTRFHSVIFSLASGVPGLAISYVGNKSVGIMADMGLADYVLHIGSVTSDELEAKFTALVRNEGDVKDKLEAYMATMSAERAALVKLIEEA